MDARDALRCLYGELMEPLLSGYLPAADGGRRGGEEVGTCSILVEPLHRGLLPLGCGAPLTVDTPIRLLDLGDGSGVTLLLYLWYGRSGVTGETGWLDLKDDMKDVRLRALAAGSEDGARLLSTLRGVMGGVPDLSRPVILRANFLKGDIDPDMELAALGALAFGGVARYPETAEVLDPASLGVASIPSKTRLTVCMSFSVRAMRSFRFFHLAADSACRRSVSPFLVTRSWTPLSIIERTLEVAGM